MFLLPLNVPVAYAAIPLSFSTTTAEPYIREQAGMYGLSASTTNALVATLLCESGYDPTQVGPYGELGIAQIYLKQHAEITKVQARDPIWSIRWAIRMFAAGKGHLWTCYNKLSLADRE